jgi:serine/threonine protein kinase
MIKICDFGLARGLTVNEQDKMTSYVTTRWYRAPELLFNENRYAKAVDMWSIGCIVAELLSKSPFLPGDSTFSQIDITFNLLGTPDEKIFDKFPRTELKERARRLPLKQRPSLIDLFPSSPGPAVDLLERLLEYNPERRISATEALACPYFYGFQGGELKDIKRFDYSFEDENLSTDDMKKMIYEEIDSFLSNDVAEKQLAPRKDKIPLIENEG